MHLVDFKDVRDYYKSVFDEWDEDGDGLISIGELKYLVATNRNVNLTKTAITALLSRFDGNNDDVLNFDEFLTLINHPALKPMYQRLIEIYLQYIFIPRAPARIKLQRTRTTTLGTANILSYEREIKCRKHTIGLFVISLLQIILYHINYNSRKNEEDFGIIDNYLAFDPCRKLEIYRYITHMFVHSNHWHLYMNIILQLLLGVPLEMVHSWRIIVVYFIGGILGCSTHSVFNITTGLAGSSGGVYSFFTAHLATVALNWSEMTHPVVSLLIFTLIVIFDVGHQVYMTYYMGIIDNSEVSIACHLGGIVTGFLLGVVILRNLRITSKELYLCVVCFVSLIAYAFVFIKFDVQNSQNVKLIQYCDAIKSNTKKT